MLGLILAIGIFYWVYTTWGLTAGAIVLVVGVIGFIVLGTSLERDRWKAHRNWTEHWKKSGAERYAERRRWEEEGKALEEERKRRVASGEQSVRRSESGRIISEVREARTAPVRRVPEQQRAIYGKSESEMSRIMGTNNVPKELFVCPRCGKMVRAESRRVLVGGQEMREYMCPRCRMRNRTEI